MDLYGIQVLTESVVASLALAAMAVFMVLKARDAIAPTHRIASYNWGSYQIKESELLASEANKHKHA